MPDAAVVCGMALGLSMLAAVLCPLRPRVLGLLGWCAASPAQPLGDLAAFLLARFAAPSWGQSRAAEAVSRQHQGEVLVQTDPAFQTQLYSQTGPCSSQVWLPRTCQLSCAVVLLRRLLIACAACHFETRTPSSLDLHRGRRSRPFRVLGAWPPPGSGPACVLCLSCGGPRSWHTPRCRIPGWSHVSALCNEGGDGPGMMATRTMSPDTEAFFSARPFFAKCHQTIYMPVA